MIDLYFDGKYHEYYFKGEKVKCVSDVLSIVDVVAMKGIPIRNIDAAAERGTRVHEQTEDYEYGLIDLTDEEWFDENNDIAPYIFAYANFIKDHPEKPIASEESIYSVEYDFAGTIDLVKYIDGKLAIIDKKTSKTISNLRSILQLNAYRIAWNEQHPDMIIEKLLILQLCDNGTYAPYDINIDENKFLRYLDTYNEIKGDKKL